VERPVDSLRQGRVAIPGEAGEGAARELDEAQVAAPRLEVANPSAVRQQLDDGVVAGPRAEQPLAVNLVGQLTRTRSIWG
jgi:hypothetical protein